MDLSTKKWPGETVNQPPAKNEEIVIEPSFYLENGIEDKSDDSSFQENASSNEKPLSASNGASKADVHDAGSRNDVNESEAANAGDAFHFAWVEGEMGAEDGEREMGSEDGEREMGYNELEMECRDIRRQSQRNSTKTRGESRSSKRESRYFSSGEDDIYFGNLKMESRYDDDCIDDIDESEDERLTNHLEEYVYNHAFALKPEEESEDEGSLDDR